MIDKLSELGKKAIEIFDKHSYVRVVSHYDSDGITAAAITCSALFRRGIRFHATIVSRLDDDVVKRLIDEEAVVFCDLGAAQPELVSKVTNADVVVLDHHPPTDRIVGVQVNPWLVGIDGSFGLSASGVAYAVARLMGDNADLAGIAFAGAMGDKQDAVGANKDILDEGLRNGVIATRRGLRLPSDDGWSVEDAIFYSTEPYLDICGEQEKIKSFLEKIGVPPEKSFNSLNESETKNLASAIFLKLMNRSPNEVLSGLIGDVYTLNRELVKDALTFTQLVSACGYTRKVELALSVCLRDESVVSETYQIYKKYQKKLIASIKNAEKKVKTGKSIYYVYAEDKDITGSLASTAERYVFADRPILVINQLEDVVKISVRGTKEHLSRGLDLSKASSDAAKIVGGVGGGHNIASGASIPAGTEDKFISAIDEIIAKQLGSAPT